MNANFSTRWQRRFGVLLTGGMTLPACLALAQDIRPEDAGAQVEEVVVTGSRIARPEIDSNSPITVVDADFFRQKGTVNVEEVLNQLPQIVPGLGAQVNNGGDGTATVDLRGLGPVRTLVLINGRRFVPATNTGRTDLNAIPANLIERVEVVTGGASAVYGSDALAGVVNFILRDDFEGIEFGGRYGVSEEGDADTTDLSLMLGGNFADDRGNAVISASFYERDPVYQDARKFSLIDKQGNGSATGVAGRLDNSPFNPFLAFNGSPAGSNYAFNEDGSVRRFVNQLPETNGGVGDRYNFSPVNYLVTPQTRRALDAFLKYQLTESVQAYSEMYFIRNEATLNLAPTPATNLILPTTNPILTDSTRALLAARENPDEPGIFRRRMVEFGPRVNDYKFDTSQFVFGFKGDLPVSDWNFDGYYSYGRTDTNTGIRGDISRTRLNASLAGCPAGAGTVPNCRVVDFFGPDKITPEDVSFLAIKSAVDTTEFERHLAQATATGSIMDLPAGPLAAAVGLEWREDSSEFIPSEASQSGDLSGFNGQLPIAGSFDVAEIYGEVNVPLVRDMPLVQYLAVNAAVRYSDYSTVGGLTSYSTGLEWRPIGEVKLRSTYAQANRAPSVFELFQAGDVNSPSVTDPCALVDATGVPQYGGTVANPAPLPAGITTICRLSGLPGDGSLPAQTNSQVDSLRIGNPALEEETGDTLTAGIVWTPGFLPQFSATIDYFDIKVEGYVSRLAGGEQGLVTNCWDSGVANAADYQAEAHCTLISRQANGELQMFAPLVNSSELKTNGVDLALSYGFDVGSYGSFRLRLDGSYVDSYELDGVEYIGTSGVDFGTLPRVRGNLRVVYSLSDFETSLNVQHIGDSDERPGEGGDTHIDAYQYLDLSARYVFDDRYTLSGGVVNLTDERPPVILTGYTNTNTDNTTYDTVGRRYFLSLSAKF